MDYQVLTEEHARIRYALKNLEEKVREDIKNGWESLGGVSIVFNEDDKQYIVTQAMIKKE